MLTYHPAFDSNHCLFRILYLLSQLSEQPHEIEKIRIFDFYLCVPHTLKLLRTSTIEERKKRDLILKSLSAYDEIDNPKSLFFDIKNIQDGVFSYLLAKGVISKGEFQSGKIFLTNSPTLNIEKIIEPHQSIYPEVIRLIKSNLANISVSGQNGLKDRSKLMEYRYDVV